MKTKHLKGVAPPNRVYTEPDELLQEFLDYIKDKKYSPTTQGIVNMALTVMDAYRQELKDKKEEAK